MKRDWDLIRRILLVVEDAKPGTHVGANQLSGPDPSVVFEHVRMLADEGYLNARMRPDSTGVGGGIFTILGLQWDGHDLLAKMRSETWWAKIKAVAQDKGVELTFDAIKVLAGPAAAAVFGIGA